MGMPLARRAYRIHRWLGTVFGGFIFVLGLTGAILVFRPEIDRLSLPDIPQAVEGTPMTASDIVGDWRARNPVAVLETVVYPIDAYGVRDWSQPFVFWGREAADGPVRRWLLNPFDASELPRPAVDIGRIIRSLHIELFLGDAPGPVRFLALIFVGAIGFAYFCSVLTGILFHRRQMRREMVRAVRTRSARVFMADIHKRVAVWALPLHLLVAGTGAFLGLEVIAVPFSSGGEERVIASKGRADVGPMDMERRLDLYADAAGKAIPGAAPIEIRLPATGDNPVVVVMRNAERLIHHYASSVRLDPADGRELDVEDVAKAALSSRLYHMVEPLHFGYYGGLPVRIVYGLFGLSLAVLAVAGLCLRWSRRKQW